MVSFGPQTLMTGGDSYFARDLFQKGKETVEITPMFKLHMICNKLPVIKDADKATWNRVRVIPFESTFVPAEECPEDFEEQLAQKKFPMDKHFSSDKIPRLVEPLAWYLIQRWRINKNTECVEPDKVRAATDTYRQDCDLYKHFEQQCIVDKPGAKLTIATLYAHFKEWYKEEFAQFQTPPRSDLRQHFISAWGPLIKNRFWENKSIGNGDYEDDDTPPTDTTTPTTLPDTPTTSSPAPTPLPKTLAPRKPKPPKHDPLDPNLHSTLDPSLTTTGRPKASRVPKFTPPTPPDSPPPAQPVTRTTRTKARATRSTTSSARATTAPARSTSPPTR
jgi:hypothetical protein